MAYNRKQIATPEYTVINLKESPETEVNNQVLTYIGIKIGSGEYSSPFYRIGRIGRIKDYDHKKLDKVILQIRGITPIRNRRQRSEHMKILRLGREDSISKLIPENTLDGLGQLKTYSIFDDSLAFVTDCYDIGIDNTKWVLNLIGTLYPEERFIKRYIHIQKGNTSEILSGRFHPVNRFYYENNFHRENVFALTITPL